MPKVMTWTNPAAAGANILAQKSADFNESTWGNLTQPDAGAPEGRNIQVVFAGWDGGTIRIEGILNTTGDNGFLEIGVAAASPWTATVECDKAFLLVHNVRNTGTAGAGTVDVQWGPKLGIVTLGKNPNLLEAYETSGNGRDTGATLSGFGLFVPTAAPNGTLDYLAVIALNNGVTDAGHVHTGGAHTHAATGLTASDAGHTHTSGAISVTDTGHVHTAGAVSITDAGHTHTAGAVSITDAGHTHTAGAVSITDTGHTHTAGAISVTDAGHTHTAGAISVTDAGHTHTAGAISVTDAGHTHTQS